MKEDQHSHAIGVDINNNIYKFKIHSTRNTAIFCQNEKLISLDLSTINVKVIQCDGNFLTSLNLSLCTDLILLYCDNNNLTNLDISNCHKLEHLYCDNIIDIKDIINIKNAYLFL